MSMHHYGLIGKSLEHSFSKQFFTEYFSLNHLDYTYNNLEFIGVKELKDFFKEDVYQYKGLNVTIPYKIEVIPFLHEVSDEVKDIGAVNTIHIKNNRTFGYNTDAFGFHQSIKPFLTNKHEKALVLGTGGASRAIEYVLKSIGIEVVFISRKPVPEDNVFTYQEINNYMLDACKLIVNCTPVGSYPLIGDEISFPYQYLSPEHLVIDLIYNPSQTLFLKRAERQGAQTLNGLSMLKEQAMKSWKIWNES